MLFYCCCEFVQGFAVEDSPPHDPDRIGGFSSLKFIDVYASEAANFAVTKFNELKVGIFIFNLKNICPTKRICNLDFAKTIRFMRLLNLLC